MSDWISVKEKAPPRREVVDFKREDGTVFRGTWGPFWCGSDCPCDVADEGIPPFDDEPVCWGAYPVGSLQCDEIDPLFWRVI